LPAVLATNWQVIEFQIHFSGPGNWW